MADRTDQGEDSADEVRVPSFWSDQRLSATSGPPGASPERPGADRETEGAVEAPRVGADDPYVDN